MDKVVNGGIIKQNWIYTMYTFVVSGETFISSNLTLISIDPHTLGPVRAVGRLVGQ
jgi:hypothetical protein